MDVLLEYGAKLLKKRGIAIYTKEENEKNFNLEIFEQFKYDESNITVVHIDILKKLMYHIQNNDNITIKKRVVDDDWGDFMTTISHIYTKTNRDKESQELLLKVVSFAEDLMTQY